MSPLRVGLTGGIAAGKSTVATWLREEGFTVIDADEIVTRLYEPGGEGSRIVVQLFGPEILHDDGTIDRRRLATRIFADPAARERLEAAVHPLVKRDFEAAARQVEEVVVLEAPLLVEAGFAPDFDLIVTVEARPATRIERAVARGLPEAEAEERMAAQTGEAERVRVAHHVLRNDGSLDDLREQVRQLAGEIRRRAASG